MPEGHTIHRLARDIAKDFRGSAVQASAVQDRFAEGAARIDGAVLTRTEAWGKHLFLHVGPVGTVHIHLGLFGKFVRRPAPAPSPSDALRLRLENNEVAWDLTGAITCDLREPAVVDEVGAKLGPDPLRRGSRGADFVARVRRSKKAIGALLMDQNVIAGVGNVYRAEILFMLGIDPHRPGTELTDEEADAIWDLTVELLRLGVKRNRIVTVPVAGRRISSIERIDATHVYKQRACAACATPIVWSEMGTRNLYHCPTCQR